MSEIIFKQYLYWQLQWGCHITNRNSLCHSTERFKPDLLFSTVKCSSTSINPMDRLSIAEERLRKLWFDYNLLPWHLQKCYLTQDKCNTNPEVRNWFQQNSATRNTYQPKNYDNLVKYVCQTVSFILWKSMVIVVLLTRAVIFMDKPCVSTALSPPSIKCFNPGCQACRKLCEKSSKSNWINESGDSSRLCCYVPALVVLCSFVPGLLWQYLWKTPCVRKMWCSEKVL